MLLLLTLGCFCAGAAIGEEPCRLEVRSVDLLGHPIPSGYFSLQGSDKRYEAGIDHIVPCGDTHALVAASAFLQELVPLAIRPGLLVRTVGLRVAPIEALGESSRVVPLEIVGFHHFRGCDRLRIIPIFRTNSIIETVISQRGRAGVTGLDAGAYSFTLVGPTGVCGFAIGQIDALAPIKVVLHAFNPEQ